MRRMQACSYRDLLRQSRALRQARAPSIVEARRAALRCVGMASILSSRSTSHCTPFAVMLPCAGTITEPCDPDPAPLGVLLNRLLPVQVERGYDQPRIHGHGYPQTGQPPFTVR